MFSFAFIAPALFFLPGFTAFSGNYIRNSKRTIRRGQIRTIAVNAFTLIVFVSLLVHAVLLAIILAAASSGLMGLEWDDSIISWPLKVIIGKADPSLTQLIWTLFYCLFAAIVGFLLGYFRKKRIQDDSIEGLFDQADPNENLQVIAYVYLYTSSPGEDCEEGYIGAVSGLGLTTGGAVSWVQLVEPTRFTVKKPRLTDDLAELKEWKDDLAELKEWKIGQVGIQPDKSKQTESEAPPTLMMLTPDNFSHVIFTLFNSKEDVEDEELPADHGGRSIS